MGFNKLTLVCTGYVNKWVIENVHICHKAAIHICNTKMLLAG